MKRGERFPNDQAEIVFSDLFLEFLSDLSKSDQEEVLIAVLGLCQNPAGKHPLSNRGSAGDLAGWNTIEVLQRRFRIVFSSKVINGVGVVEVLLGGPRSNDAVYDMASSLQQSGALSDEEVTQIWTALTILEVVAEHVGLDGWDYRPEPAPEGLIKSAVAASLIEESIARTLSKSEIEAALEKGWSEFGPDRAAALNAALKRARAGAHVNDATHILLDRMTERCDAVLPRAGRRCIRKSGHPGAHRATP